MITVIFNLLYEAFYLYRWVVIAAAIYMTLVSFGVLDTRNRALWKFGDVLYRLTEPALAPIRRFLPDFGGIDFSPLVLLVLIEVVMNMLPRIQAALITGQMSTLLF